MTTTTLTPQIVEKQLLEIVQQLLIEAGEENTHKIIGIDASLHRHLGIDSLGRAELFQRIEKKFEVELPENLLVEADTLEDILKAILKASPAHKIDFQSQIPNIGASPVNPMEANTLNEALYLHATASPDRPHIYFQNEHGKEEVITYQNLMDAALRIAAALQKDDLHPGDTVAIMLPTHPSFFYVFFGVLLAGGIPVPIYPPLRPSQIEAYAKLEAKILQNAQVRFLITFHEAENLSRLLRSFIPSLKTITTAQALLQETEKAKFFGAKPDDFALIQYTSGSTSAPKGVLLAHENLLANLRSYGKAIQVTSREVYVSWLPLYHDLGLIGAWLGSLYFGTPLTILSPLTFLNHPERWLWAIHYHRGTISGGPNFAYELCVKKIDLATIEGLDLSSWRIAANGAEAIQPKTLERFIKKFKPFGFKPETLFPVYGLAESTVGLTAPPLGRVPRIDTIERKAFEEKRIAVPVSYQDAKKTLEFVSCGKAMPDHAIRVVDENNNILPERTVGKLQFTGPSSMRGYFRNPEATKAVYHDGWWDTGDLAYFADEEIYIAGRTKDVIIKAGRNLYPAEVEALAAQVPEIRQGCVIAFGVTDMLKGTEKLIVVAETNENHHLQQIGKKVTEKILSALDIAPDQVILVPPRTIPKTSSGKLQRVACRNSYLEGKLTGSSLPVWMQIVKLKLRSSSVNFYRYFEKFGKILYTTYAAILMLFLLPPMWLTLFIFPPKISRKILKVWAIIVCLLAFCPFEVRGKKYLRQFKSVIYAANHASYLDALILSAALPSNIVFVGKRELMQAPVLGSFMKRLGHVFIDREDTKKGLEETKMIQAELSKGNSLVIFPEGTFSYAAGLRPFKLGTFKMAADTNSPVVPVALNGTRHILRGEELLLQPGKMRISICEPVTPQGNDWQEITRLKNHVRSEIAKYCGEPTLDMIAAGVSAPIQTSKQMNSEN